MIRRFDLKYCPIKKKVQHPDTGRVKEVSCGAKMHHFEDHSECPRCGFYIQKDEVYDPKKRETSRVRQLQ